jgi:hypothetical protein
MQIKGRPETKWMDEFRFPFLFCFLLGPTAAISLFLFQFLAALGVCC